MSSLAWIDFDEAERQRAQRIMALFQERESRDELGLGSIRDSIADHLFPGTSTIQTRLRYMLFIPWLFQMLEGSTHAPDRIAAEARGLENRLANALKAGGESNGIIGRDAGADLQRLPSSVYWAGLGTWGIRIFPGSTDNLFSSIRHLQSGLSQVRESENASREAQGKRIWTSMLPPPPKELLNTTTFQLKHDEAQFIIDRLVSQQPQSLLAKLARNTDTPADCRYIWEHPNLADFSEEARTLVSHGEIFSSVMHGASLLYNLLLSGLREQQAWIDVYQARLLDWRDQLDLPSVRAWSLDSFWQAVDHPTHRIRPAAKRFVTEWLDQVRAGAVTDNGQNAAARLVQDREQRLKTNQSRFANRAVRDRWTGASGTERMSFRWTQAKRHLQDIANAK
jgi:hypothetical protein